MLHDDLLDETLRNQFPLELLRKQWFDEKGLLRVSASRLKLYKECRYRYYKQYVLGEPIPAHHSVILGKAVHYAIEQQFKQQQPAVAAFEAKLDELDPYREYSEYHHAGLDILHKFDFSQYRPIEQGNERLFVEQLTSNVYVLGFIDLIDERGWIVDFKTSQYKPKSIDDDLQFAIYAWVYERLFFEWPSRVIWHHVRTGEIVEANIYKLFTQTLPKAKQLAERLANDPFDDVRKCDVCKYYCPFKKEAAH